MSPELLTPEQYGSECSKSIKQATLSRGYWEHRMVRRIPDHYRLKSKTFSETMHQACTPSSAVCFYVDAGTAEQVQRKVLSELMGP